MNASGKHPPGRAEHRLGITTAAAASILLISIGAAIAAVWPGARSVAPLRPAEVTDVSGTASASAAQQGAGQPGAGKMDTGGMGNNQLSSQLSNGQFGLAFSALTASVPLVLTTYDRQACPASAAACVDLARHITWLQAHGQVTFGPVQMEPGPPGTVHATPAGTFNVSWKAGPDYVSNTYHEPMPWATFFAAGGIAFHGGSLTRSSHGCVHLTVADAHYYNEHLPIGAEVVVF